MFLYGSIDNSSFENSFNTIIANPYMITADIIAIIVAKFSIIIPDNTEYMKYEHIPIIVTAIIGFTTNWENVKFNFIFFLNAVIAILNATAWHATDAQAAPFTPIDGIGTNIRFNINFTITPASGVILLVLQVFHILAMLHLLFGLIL